MKAEVITKKKVAVKAAVKAKAVEPFGSVIDEAPSKKRVVKKTALKKTVRAAAKPVVLDPFAELVVSASPVKKIAKKSKWDGHTSD